MYPKQIFDMTFFIIKSIADNISVPQNISANGISDVTSFKDVNVQVPASAVVSGSINVTTNSTVDVTDYQYAIVQVPASAVVSGTYTATSNGTFDVTNYASVQISIPTYTGEIEEITR